MIRVGTTKDNQHSPIHRWFRYSAGFSYHLVGSLISLYGIKRGQLVLDPFVGCGTTAVEAKKQGVDCIGIEANPLAWWIANVKCFWEYDINTLEAITRDLQDMLARSQGISNIDISGYPPLIYKCYSPENLQMLTFIRETIEQSFYGKEKDFLRLALVSILRRASKISSGWSYIALSEHHRKKEDDAIRLFNQQISIMIEDLRHVCNYPEPGRATILLSDARCEPIADGCVDLVVTSPPYLNNYDYAEQSRLEMYFLGWARSWPEVVAMTQKLLTSTTSQVTRSMREKSQISEEIKIAASDMYNEINSKIGLLGEIRKHRGGRKNYDLVVARYINDMFQVLKEIYRVLKPGGRVAMVIGDSAPYGVHIPTEEYIRKLGLIVGFNAEEVYLLRKRGDKWGSNSIRHHVPLKESLLILSKDFALPTFR